MKRRYNVALREAGSLGSTLAEELAGGEIFALIGPMGSGKTTFSKSLGQGLKIRQTITSPTFPIMNQYPLMNFGKQKNTVHSFLYHLDLYRTESFAEIEQLGITEVWGKENIITVIEWADKIKNQLPKKTIFIYFSHN